MSYCLNPLCQAPDNLDLDTFCQACGSPLSLRKRYLALRKLGQGGFGRTFLAQDCDIPSRPYCVIKQLQLRAFGVDTADKAKQLFQQEAVRLDELGKHPQIPNLFAYFSENEQWYLVQEWIDGQTLAEELHQQGAYTEEQIWQLLRDLVPVLEFIHQRRVIHRDIKPMNVIRRQSDRLPILIDFGIAKQFDRRMLVQTGTLIGSPEYISPEQMKGKAVPASDLYSLGVMCVHLLTHLKSPLDLYNIVDDRWDWRDFLPPERRVSDRLGRILDKMLQASLSQRFQSATDLLEVLNPPPGAIALSSNVSVEWVKAIQSDPTPPTVSIRQPLAFAKSLLGIAPPEQWLRSSTGVDYTALRNHLAASRWQAADEETWAVLCQALGKRPRNYLWSADTAKLPCEDLQIIDLLWQKYSEGHFGFSVQCRIFTEVEEDYVRFCDRVGWPVYNTHTSGKGIAYSRKAPAGHLPSRIWAGGSQWWRQAKAMLLKLDNCEFIHWESNLS
ncbi:MAG: protein kinase [Desertifilum sp. SIO1I2]|nr:protein kinase [Desertifilum sp. SIO1I2]